MLLSLLAFACQDYTINEKLSGEPIIAPDFIDFGHLRSGHETGLRQIIFSNGGNAPLNVDYIQIEGERFDIDTSGFTVEPLMWHALDLSYMPETYEFNEGYLDVYLEGVDEPVSSVWFQGWGDAPLMEIEPPSVDFGTLSEDCDIDREIQITNNGNLDLEIYSIQQLATLPQQITVDYGTLPDFPWVLPPNARISFWTEFLAEGLSTHSLELKVDSNDPSAPLNSVIVEGETMISTTMIENFTQGTAIFVDIIWIIDNSGSMASFQALLASNLSSFINLFMSYSPDFQMAFITTDDFAFVDGVHFTNNDANLVNDAAALIDSIGTRGSAQEKGLAMLDLSITHNQGWFRPNAKLVAIFLSDERDWSSQIPYYYIGRYNLQYAQGDFLPFGIIGDVPAGCGGLALPGNGYYDVINHYNSTWWSICDPDWGTQMQDIALAVVNSSSYGLDHPTPKEDTIQVFINGQELTEGWSYNIATNSISFEIDTMPESGDTVEVSYEIWECE